MNDAPLLIDSPQAGVCRWTLNRPQRCNAYSPDLLDTMFDSLDSLESDASNRVVIIRGAGSVFCGGLDLKLAAENDLQAGRKTAGRVLELLGRILTSPLIFIAAAQKAARGGGAGLVAACDFAIVDDRFTIAFPEVQRGLSPALLFPILRRKLSDPHLRELLLTGSPVGAVRGREMGLIHSIVAEEELDATALDFAGEILQGNPGSVRSAKALINSTSNSSEPSLSLEGELRHAFLSHLESWDSPSGREGVTAFLEKRAPNWENRSHQGKQS
jgi:methylglutaconyl-CoA hydratase